MGIEEGQRRNRGMGEMVVLFMDGIDLHIGRARLYES